MSAAVPAEGLSCPATASPVPSVEHGDGQSLRDELRSLPSIVGQAPDFDVQSAPANPRGLFLDWLRHAIDAQVPEPHAATLSTVDAGGMPDARVLIVKDVTAECGFRIATGDESAKGIQLRSNPQCALTFYWGPLARAVRIRGIAESRSEARPLNRPLTSAAATLLPGQSPWLAGRAPSWRTKPSVRNCSQRLPPPWTLIQASCRHTGRCGQWCPYRLNSGKAMQAAITNVSATSAKKMTGALIRSGHDFGPDLIVRKAWPTRWRPRNKRKALA